MAPAGTDLVVSIRGELLRVEVCSADYRKDRTLPAPNRPPHYQFDMLVVFVPSDRSIHYFWREP